MKAARIASIAAIAVAVISAAWALVAWNTGLGGDLFIRPGGWIADVVLPAPNPTKTFQAQSANSVGEALAQFVIARGFERGLQAWWCALAFWLVLLPLLTFVGIFTVRRHGT
jgi:hypothetical protein